MVPRCDRPSQAKITSAGLIRSLNPEARYLQREMSTDFDAIDRFRSGEALLDFTVMAYAPAPVGWTLDHRLRREYHVRSVAGSL